MSTHNPYGLPEALYTLHKRLAPLLLAESELITDRERLRQGLDELLIELLREQNVMLARGERHKLFDALRAELLGWGPLEHIFSDEHVTDIWVLGAKQVFVTRRGQREQTDVVFENEEHVERVIERITTPLGKIRPASEAHRMQDGSYVQIIRRPLSLTGPALHILKWSRYRLTSADLLRFGTLSTPAWTFLRAAVLANLNVLVVGAAQAGKTTLLNVLAAALPSEFFVVTIEGFSPELQLSHQRVLTLQVFPMNAAPHDEGSAYQLAAQAGRFQADYVVLSGTQGAGLLALLETGRFFMLDVTAYHAEGALRRLRDALHTDQPDLSEAQAQNMLLRGLDLIVEMHGMTGARKVTRISEINPDGTFSAVFDWSDEQQRLLRTDYQPRCLILMADAGLTPDLSASEAPAE